MLDATRRVLAAATAVGLAVLVAATAAPAQEKKAAPPNPVGATGGDWSTSAAKDGAVTAKTFDAKQTALLQELNAYFNALNNMRGVFVQTGADKKKMKGRFYVKKPGRLRFDYASPSKMRIVSDGQYLAIQDTAAETDDRIALDSTPFRILLRKDVDLLRDAHIFELQEAEDLIVITLQDKSPDAPGRIRLFLTRKPTLDLKEWVTTDAQGGDTRVEVSDLVRSEEIDANLFKIEAIGLEKAKKSGASGGG